MFSIHILIHVLDTQKYYLKIILNEMKDLFRTTYLCVKRLNINIIAIKKRMIVVKSSFLL